MYSILKRLLDIVFSLIMMIILIPIYLIVAIIIKLESKGPALFIQKRLGKHGKEYNIYKFRSMSIGAEKTGSGVYSGKGDPRVTKVGRIIRATSIDELPQLFNILKGDMSFIGPRPPLTYHPWPIDQYTDEQKKMFDVRPGVTGWGQVNGRKDVEWNKRIQLNCWYVDNMSLLLDIRILFLTGIKVITLDGNLNVGSTVVKPDNNSLAEAAATAEDKENI